MDANMLCAVAKVSRSGYYKWLKQADIPDKDYDDYLLIKEILDKGKRKYGRRTIQMKLIRQGITMNHKKIIRIMKKYHLAAKIRRRSPYRTSMKEAWEHKTFANKLNREFHQTVPLKAFCTDITYLPFGQKCAYLSVVKDIASREIVSWNLAQRMEMDLVINMLTKMGDNKKMSLENAIIHSDQGAHYTNSLYIGSIKRLKMVQSMSRKGNAIDNAPVESFFGHLKDDVDYKSCKTFDDLGLLIREYMTYYNYNRPQWELKKMTPVEYRNHLLNSG